MVRRKQL